MKQYKTLLFILLVLVGCQKDSDKLTVIVPPYEENPIVYVNSSIFGEVVDSNGEPISGVSVKVESNMVDTDSEGKFELRNVTIKKNGTHISTTKSGYFKGGTTCFARSENVSFVRISLEEKGAPTTLDASLGGEVLLGNDVEIDFPPNSLRTASGALYTGTANLYARYMDPLDPELGKDLPADLVGIDKFEEEKALSTLGILQFELEDMNGNELTLDSAEVTIPIPPDLQGSVPAQVPLWYFDVETGHWYQGGICVNLGVFCSTICTSSGYCSPCIPLDPVELNQIVLNNDGTPASYALIKVNDLVDTHAYWGYTDSLGYWQGTVPESRPLQQSITDHCFDVLYDQPIGAFATDTQLPELSLSTIVSTQHFSIIGVLTDCAGMPSLKGHLSVAVPGHGYFTYEITASGAFEIDIYLNCAVQPTLELRGYDNNDLQRTVVYPLSGPGTYNLGTIATCEAKDDFFETVIDGNTFHYFPAQIVEDYSRPGDYTISAKILGNKYVSLQIENYSGTGIYNTGLSMTIDNVNSTLFGDYWGDGVVVNITSDNGTLVTGQVSGVLNSINGPQSVNANFKAYYPN